MASQVRYTLLQPNGDCLSAPIIGRGATAIIVRDGQSALKLPLRYGIIGLDGAFKEHDDATTEESYEAQERESKVYQRLAHHDDVVACLESSAAGIRLELMENGSLEEYLSKSKESPACSLQLDWFRAMTRALSHVHQCRILAADIAIRNFLVSANLTVKLSDFNQSIILPPETDMETASESGFSVGTDIGQLGAVFFTVATGQACEFDLFKDLPFEPSDAIWPQRESLPSTESIWIGPIIERCWTKSWFRSADELLDCLNSINL